MRNFANTSRNRRRGAAVGYAMLFFVAVTISGSTFLAITAQHQLQLMHYGLTARLRAATENALETTRGRFTLVAGTQENWDTLLPNSGWNTIQTVVIDSVSVVVSGQSVGTASSPQCQLRAIGTLSGRQWACLYEFKMTSLGDFSMYSGGNNTQTLPSHLHVNGGYYSKTTINMNNASDIHFYKGVATAGSVVSPSSATFAEGYTENATVIDFQPALTTFPDAKAAAASANIHYSNTWKIELRGTSYRRYYEHKTGNNSYTQLTQDIAIPNNGIIYIENDGCPASGIDANIGYTNSRASRGNGASAALKLFGWLGNGTDQCRVSIYCEDGVDLVNNITYQSLMSTPDLRRVGQKKSPAAKAIPEMLAVISEDNIALCHSDWTPLPTAYEVTNDPAFVAWDGTVYDDDEHKDNQYAFDGVFVGYSVIDRGTGNLAGSGTTEFWLCGSIISGNAPFNNTLDICDRTNIDWDWRLEDEEPPFLIKTYGSAPPVIAGSFRSYNPAN
ncbi:MAG: hypothetical protein IT462_12965 [Planctomycetes bacterium]|nr:hypothetical protein [Planctomycetota bacterium]